MNAGGVEKSTKRQREKGHTYLTTLEGEDRSGYARKHPGRPLGKRNDAEANVGGVVLVRDRPGDIFFARRRIGLL